ncbi:MAG: hypothetical protein JSV92_03465 [archaeon]|nr:MAG: hypothetical protein JSV92_03465 [archaeon]
MTYRKGYRPWLYVNWYTLLSALGRLTRRSGAEIECRGSGIYAKDTDKVIIFNLIKRFRIEMAEVRIRKGFARNPFRTEFLTIMVAKTGNRVRVKSVFPVR